eukprot:11476.XXX_513214_513315_1 [CDS] Oithona nana genome sequencing.
MREQGELLEEATSTFFSRILHFSVVCNIQDMSL